MAIAGSRTIRARLPLILMALACGGGSSDAAALYQLIDYGDVNQGSRDFNGIGLDGRGGVTFGAQDAPTAPYRVTSFNDYSLGEQVSYRIDEAGNRLRVPFLASIGSVTDTTNVTAFAVNRSGEVVGYAEGGRDGGYYSQALMFSPVADPDHSLRVPLPQGAGNSGAYALNDAGLIVGTFAFKNTGVARAFLSDGKVGWDLNTLIAPGSGLLLSSAVGIDGLGQIVGYAEDSHRRTHTYLLTPTTTPEPSVLLGGACLGFGSLVARALRRGGHRSPRRARREEKGSQGRKGVNREEKGSGAVSSIFSDREEKGSGAVSSIFSARSSAIDLRRVRWQLLEAGQSGRDSP